MGFKLPGKSVQSGTSAHSSALKMYKESMAKKTLVGDQKNLPEELRAKIEAAPGKMTSPAKASEFGAEYRKNRDAGKKYFTYKGREYTTESRSEKAKREESGKTYAELNPKKSRSMTKTLTTKKKSRSMTKTFTTKKDDPLTKEIKDMSDVKKVEGPREGTKKEKVQVAKKNVKDVRKEAKVKTLKAKKDVADAKGKSKRSERLERKIERKKSRLDGDKSTNITRRDQRKREKEVQKKRKEAKQQKGNSPATYANAPTKKHKVETPMAPKTTEKKKSKKIGPAISDEMLADLRNKRDDAEMNLNVSDDQAAKDGAKVQKRIKEEREYIKR